jgi:hypothetical protein
MTSLLFPSHTQSTTRSIKNSRHVVAQNRPVSKGSAPRLPHADIGVGSHAVGATPITCNDPLGPLVDETVADSDSESRV